ncbi:MAG: M20 family metallopeptidase [Acidimicrobiia bacterium]|nr:M20 family metallopeptidase [Acidimicrobiia bacterium]
MNADADSPAPRHGQPTEPDYLSAGYVAQVLAELVRIPSTNPGAYESDVARRVVKYFEATPVEAKLVESLPGRHSVGATLRGCGDGPRLILNGHLDTVPIDDESEWTTDPFGAEVRDGFMYGRGACDMKAGLAVQIAVAHHLAGQLDRLAGSLVLHFAAGEERAEPGTLSLLEAGYTGDFGIVTEPTDLRIAAATRGLLPLRIRLQGRSIHASRSHLGINPTWGLLWVLGALEGYRSDIEQRRHHLLGAGSCTPTVVNGGVTPNAVSDSVDLYVDRRLVPGETIEREVQEVTERILAARPAGSEVGVDVTVAYNRFEPAEIPVESWLVQRLVGSVKNVTGAPGEVYGAPFSSDVRNLVNDAGIEAVNFGPGNVAECHCADERVALSQLEGAARVIADLAADLLMAA